MNTNVDKTALITGIRGQDGSYLAEQLLTKGYRVVGTSHEIESNLYPMMGHADVNVARINLSSTSEVKDIIANVRPHEVYNLAARSSSAQLFDDPIATAEINGLAAVRILEAIREVSPSTRFCQAASSEVFAGTAIAPQDESTPYRPVNAYGAAKTFAANMVKAYRARHGLFATTAILFNHESPRRGMDYVTRKITHTVAKIALGQADSLVLGNLDSRRDWGFAGDYARAMWMMLQHAVPDDYVIATGETHSVREFCEVAFSHVGLDYRDFVRIDPRWARRTETVELCGNPLRIKQCLGWQPSVSFEELVRMMVDADFALLKLNQN
jgi:GDPmannose 4,6-dehydratase